MSAQAFFSSFCLGVDELLDVAVPIAQGVHLGGAAGFAAGFDHVGHLVIDLEEGERAAGPAAAAQLLLAGADRARGRCRCRSRT